MKVWFTRPSNWDVYVAGVGRCQMWLQKPSYDATPRGKERDSFHPTLPLGWRVVDSIYGDITHQVAIEVRRALTDSQVAVFSTVLDPLWEALCRSVDGMGSEEMGGALKRWQAVDSIDSEREDVEMATFCFEVDAPPELWFCAALRNGFDLQTAAGAWAQQEFWLDTEMGLEAEDPPPVENPVIQYETGSATTSQGAIV